MLLRRIDFCKYTYLIVTMLSSSGLTSTGIYPRFPNNVLLSPLKFIQLHSVTVYLEWLSGLLLNEYWKKSVIIFLPYHSKMLIADSYQPETLTVFLFCFFFLTSLIRTYSRFSNASVRFNSRGALERILKYKQLWLIITEGMFQKTPEAILHFGTMWE